MTQLVFHFGFVTHVDLMICPVSKENVNYNSANLNEQYKFNTRSLSTWSWIKCLTSFQACIFPLFKVGKCCGQCWIKPLHLLNQVPSIVPNLTLFHTHTCGTLGLVGKYKGRVPYCCVGNFRGAPPFAAFDSRLSRAGELLKAHCSRVPPLVLSTFWFWLARKTLTGMVG